MKAYSLKVHTSYCQKQNKPPHPTEVILKWISSFRPPTKTLVWPNPSSTASHRKQHQWYTMKLLICFKCFSVCSLGRLFACIIFLMRKKPVCISTPTPPSRLLLLPGAGWAGRSRCWGARCTAGRHFQMLRGLRNFFPSFQLYSWQLRLTDLGLTWPFKTVTAGPKFTSQPCVYMNAKLGQFFPKISQWIGTKAASS